MSRKLDRWGLAALLLALLVGFGCSGESQEEAANQAADDEAWAQVEEQKAELDAARQELEAARQAADAEDEDAETAEDADADPEAAGDEEAAEGAEGAEPVDDVAQLENQVNDKAADFYQALVDYLNNSGMVEGEELTERQSQAMRMKSEEDIMLAQEYIDKGGNYPKAIQIYRDALAFDPDNAELQAALAEAEGNRYMSEERFAQAEEGMTQAEVRELLGQPNLSNIRKFPEDNVEAWFYPTDVHGSAAALWFRQRDGSLKVYKMNFEEVVRDGPTEVGAEEEDGDADA